MLLRGLNSRVVCAVIMLMVVVGELAPRAEAVITCGQVTNFLIPCIGYLKNGGFVPGRCCAGVRALVAAARTRPYRQRACFCLKGAYTGYRGIKLPNAQSLPAKCRANIPYRISPTTDCSRQGGVNLVYNDSRLPVTTYDDGSHQLQPEYLYW